jgi:excinuclease ABC subunit C
LTDIPTVGEKRAAALMKHFKTLRALSEATEEELLLVPGINRPSAEAICQYFRETKENRKNS